MQQDQMPAERIVGRRKWMRPLDTNNQLPTHVENEATSASRNDVTMQPTLSMQSVPPTPRLRYDANSNQGPDSFHMQPDTDISNQATAHLMKLSGRIPITPVLPQSQQQNIWNTPNHNNVDAEEGYWPDGIQQTGPLPVVNLYGNEPFGKTQPLPLAIPASPVPPKRKPAWKALLTSPAAKVTIGLLIGIGLLFLVSRFVDIPTTIRIIKQSLSTPRGIILGLLSGVAFLTAFSIRGIRWKLFLNPIGHVSTFKAIQLFLVGIFLNFLLPIRGGEVAKSLMLKRVANIPISRSLPTVAMDKALDLMPALFIMAIVPLLGVQMDIKLWIVLATVGGLLLCLIFFIVLAAWKRTAAISLLHKMTLILPKAFGSKIEGFATGFVDSLLMGASRPRIFIPAMLLTCVAVIFDGLFAMLAFWTIGSPSLSAPPSSATPFTTCSTSCPPLPDRSAATKP
jgi:uncharacterized protein (TIRG00374 family)